MKKLFVLVLVCILTLAGCSDQALRQEYPEYYDLPTDKGLDLYMWETEGGSYCCGLLPGTNRNKSYTEIYKLIQNSATIAQMRTILSSYDIEETAVSIFPLTVTLSGFEYAIELREHYSVVFWET